MQLCWTLLRCAFLVSALSALAAGVSSPVGAKDTWIEARSSHFIVVSNAGDKETRRIAEQFEQFREVFRSAFPSLRVDLGCPLIIFGLKNEDSLKVLLPRYWEVKGRAHPAGIYVSGEDRHFVALRTNTEGENPYEVIYHEYAHAILNLNFRDMPVWLSEGLAEYFGNSRILDKEVEIGVPAPYRLQTLKQSSLIPIEELFSADQASLYYNEQNRVSVFYAESWAIVHYLLLDPEARQQQLLLNFIKAWEASGDQVDAARKTFGDLKLFSQTIQTYVRKQQFTVGTVKTIVRTDARSMEMREMPSAELAAYRALFYIHTRRPAEADVAIREALRLNPQLSLAYEAQGLQAYTKTQFAPAVESFAEATKLPGASFSAFYFDAASRLRAGIGSEEEHQQVIADLEKAVAMNPLFAPAYTNLASLYSGAPDTNAKAIQLARKAVDLDPANLQYTINFARVLLNAGKLEEAKSLAERINHAAWTPADKTNAQELMHTIADYEEQLRQAAERAEKLREAQAAAIPVVVTPDITTSGAADPRNLEPRRQPKETRTLYMAEGVIAEAECNSSSRGRVTLTVNHSAMRFLYSSLDKLAVVEGLDEDSGNAPACADWKGKRVRLFFYETKDRPYTGELQTVQFF